MLYTSTCGITRPILETLNSTGVSLAVRFVAGLVSVNPYAIYKINNIIVEI